MPSDDKLSTLVESSNFTNPSVSAAFEINWETLSSIEKQLSCLISLFANAPVPWKLIELAMQKSEIIFDSDNLLNSRQSLLQQKILQISYENNYVLHDLIRDLLQLKIIEISEESSIKNGFCKAIVEISNKITQTLDRDEISRINPCISHIAECASNLNDWLSNDDLILPFIGLSRYYQVIGLSYEAEAWLKKCLHLVKKRLGATDQSISTILNNLGSLHSYLRNFNDAEFNYRQALELDRINLPKNHPYIFSDLNNLGTCYLELKYIQKAEEAFQEALSICPYLEGKERDASFATVYNNLASLYSLQERKQKAEYYYTKALNQWE